MLSFMVKMREINNFLLIAKGRTRLKGLQLIVKRRRPKRITIFSEEEKNEGVLDRTQQPDAWKRED